MQDHIEERLNKPITLHGLARSARYSPYYAARIFKELTGKPPFEYIRERRLSAAALALQRDSAKIIDVAFDFVFDSHEGFSRAFARQFGMTPSAFRKAKPSVSVFMPEQMRDYYTNLQKGAKSMSEKEKTDVVFVQVLERPKRKLIVKRGQQASHYFEYCDEVGCEVWEQLAAITDALHEPMGLWLPEVFRRPGTSTYVQGVEVDRDYSGDIPEGFDVIDLPPCKMMVFQGQPFDDSEYEHAIKSLWDVINSYKPETIGFNWADDDGPRFQLEPVGYRGYIEGRPVRSVS
ncbi:MAG: AraC family transcriptional regulator [Deltaproteobacteria bacterium]|nr:AraC family transcriptional regulator [Deltaproteobacteria bacterium]